MTYAELMPAYVQAVLNHKPRKRLHRELCLARARQMQKAMLAARDRELPLFGGVEEG